MAAEDLQQDATLISTYFLPPEIVSPVVVKSQNVRHLLLQRLTWAVIFHRMFKIKNIWDLFLTSFLNYHFNKVEIKTLSYSDVKMFQKASKCKNYEMCFYKKNRSKSAFFTENCRFLRILREIWYILLI